MGSTPRQAVARTDCATSSASRGHCQTFPCRERAGSDGPDAVYLLRTFYGVLYTVCRFWRFLFSRKLRCPQYRVKERLPPPPIPKPFLCNNLPRALRHMWPMRTRIYRQPPDSWRRRERPPRYAGFCAAEQGRRAGRVGRPAGNYQHRMLSPPGRPQLFEGRRYVDLVRIAASSSCISGSRRRMDPRASRTPRDPSLRANMRETTNPREIRVQGGEVEGPWWRRSAGTEDRRPWESRSGGAASEARRPEAEGLPRSSARARPPLRPRLIPR
jgi:hypothetical protein